MAHIVSQLPVHISPSILESMPICFSYWTERLSNMYCNKEYEKLFGCASKKDSSINSLLPPVPASKEYTQSHALAYIDKALSEGECHFSWQHETLAGKVIPTNVHIIRMVSRGEIFFACYIYDLSASAESQVDVDKSVESMKLMFDNAPMASQVWDREYNLLECSQEVVRLFKVKDKAEYLRTFFNLSPKFQPNGRNSFELVRESVDKAFSEGFFRLEWLHQTYDGELIPAEVTLLRSTLMGQDVVISYIKDLRDFYTSLSASREKDERTQLILDSMPIGMCLWDRELKIIDYNWATVEMFALPHDKPNTEFLKRITPKFQPDGTESFQKMQNLLNTALQQGVTKCEWEAHTLLGKGLTIEVSLVRIMLRGEYLIVGYFRDLHETKFNMQSMQRAEERLRKTLDNAPLCINIWNRNFELIDCNQEAVRLFGLESKQEFLQKINTLFPERQSDGRLSSQMITDELGNAFMKGNSKIEAEAMRPNGEVFLAEVTLVRTEFVNETFVIAYVRDLTEIKAYVRELKKAREFAEKSDKAKGEFLANMSHEIRTPMNGILGLLHLLSATKLNESQDTYVQNSLFSANNLLRIIDDILDFSKIEAGKLEIEYIPFTLHEIIVELENLYLNKITGKGLEFHLNKGEYPDTLIMGDPLRLKQVLFNLTSNAIKFTKQGSITISITCELLNEHEMRCSFSVSDTGIGLTDEQRNKLFSAFTQADTSVSRQYGGTGLGLVISKSIVELMRGEIGVVSEPGLGSTFTFTTLFDLYDAENILHKQASPEVIEIAETVPQNCQGRILLVEDNDINQLIATELLENVGYTVRVASNGLESIDILNAEEIDLVLMDIQMPVMDGLTATRRIRQNPAFKDLPIVAMSAHAMLGDKETSLKNGMNDHITKPISPSTLYTTIEHWLKNKEKTDS